MNNKNILVKLLRLLIMLVLLGGQTAPGKSTALYPEELAPLAAGDENWDYIFGSPGINGNVHTITIGGGNIYAGGSFLTAYGKDGFQVNNVARWDGCRWHALGSGVSGVVRAIAFDGNDVYVGGDFTAAGGQPANHVAKWDGQRWSTLGSGVNGNVFAIAIIEHNVYVGGQFTSAGELPINYVAKWDGVNWSALGTGMSGIDVRAIVAYNNDLYIGGRFVNAGGVTVNNLAKWDGTNWSALGSGEEDDRFSVDAIAIYNGLVYAAAIYYSTSGSVTLIEKWDGNAWSTMGNSFGDGIGALAVDPAGDVYISDYHLRKWDGNTWVSVAGDPLNVVLSLTFDGEIGYVGGVGGVSMRKGDDWLDFTSRLDNYAYSLATSGTSLYVGGGFKYAGPVLANGIARWDGTCWHSLGSGATGDSYPNVSAIVVSGNNVYMGGNFDTAGGISANNVARWDGSAWHALGSGVNESVFAIAVLGNDVYAGGRFTTAGGNPARYIARWDGNEWSALGEGLNEDLGSVFAITAIGSDVYVGGDFRTAGGTAVNYIARWDGSTWHAVGQGMNSAVLALATNGSDLYAGGMFYQAGGNDVSGIAKWNGSSWSSLGDGVAGGGGMFGPTVETIFVDVDKVYVGGDFSEAGDAPAKNVAMWDGSIWSGFGSGTYGIVSAIMKAGSNLYVAGGILYVGGKEARGIGRWWNRSIIISGTAEGIMGLPNTFSSQLIAPDSMTTSYIWEATEQAQIVRESSLLTDTISYTWNMPGVKTITVTAVTGSQVVSDTFQTLIDVGFPVYLPLVSRH